MLITGSCCSVSAFSTHRSSTAISATDTRPYQPAFHISLPENERPAGGHTGHPQVRGAPQGLRQSLPTVDMSSIAKHGSLPHLPRVNRILLQQVLCPHKQGQPQRVMINEGASMLDTHTMCDKEAQ